MENNNIRDAISKFLREEVVDSHNSLHLLGVEETLATSKKR